MGSLSASPKVPQSTPQVVYVPTSTPTVSATSEPVTPSIEEQAAQTRKQGLLSRNRGVLGTIATSFRGFLTPTETGKRKTLLGE